MLDSFGPTGLFEDVSVDKMNKSTPFLFLALFAFFVSGCAAVLVGGAFYKGSKTKGQRQEFTAQFQKNNTEREKAGLKSLDWCSEAYKFDEGWADNDKECAKRIAAYKKGDKTALEMGR